MDFSVHFWTYVAMPTKPIPFSLRYPLVFEETKQITTVNIGPNGTFLEIN